MKTPRIQILLVEDNPDHAILIKEILQQVKEIGKITLIEDGQKADDFMQRAKRERKFPDLILLDLKLPRLNGFDLLKIWKSDPILKSRPVVILSTSNIEKDRQHALALGADRYLVKPTNFDLLYEEIRKIIQEMLLKVAPL